MYYLAALVVWSFGSKLRKSASKISKLISMHISNSAYSTYDFFLKKYLFSNLDSFSGLFYENR